MAKKNCFRGFKLVSSATRLARKLRLRSLQVKICYFLVANNKGAVQTGRMHTLICAFIVSNPRTQALLSRGPIIILLTADNQSSMTFDDYIISSERHVFHMFH